MASRWLGRLAVVATIVVVALVPSATAQGQPGPTREAAPGREAIERTENTNWRGGAEGLEVAIRRPASEQAAELVGPLPITAAQAVADAPSCTDWATGPYADQDLWRFRLASGTFLSLAVSFLDANGDDVNRTVENIDGGTAWIATTAGWSLASVSAVVTGDATTFQLARVCPAAAGPRESVVGGLAPAVGGRPGTGARPASSQGATSTPTALAAGTDVAATFTVGSALVLAGLLLLIVRRRPRGRHRMRESAEPSSTLTWTS